MSRQFLRTLLRACVRPSARASLSVLALLSVLFLVGAALTVSPLAAADPTTPAGIGLQWPNYNLKLNGQRFSPLDQINTTNVGQLGEICRVQVDGPTSFTAGLIVVDGTIYTTTSAETVALDATTCALR